MEMNEGEVFDRWTILKMKRRFDQKAESEFRRFDEEVMALLTAKRYGSQKEMTDLVNHMVDLMEANAKIWNLEASLRQEFKDDPNNTGEVTDAEFGRRAKAIREHNKLRVEAKAKIDRLFGRVPDVKVNHASQ